MYKNIKPFISKRFPGFFNALKVLRKKLSGRKNFARYRLPLNMSVEGFFYLLQKKNIHYVVLRWFDNLPFVRKGEDIDLLIADHDIETVKNILVWGTAGIPCDIYSESGLPGSSFKNMAYFPPTLSKNILNNSEIKNDLYHVPSSIDYFFLLSYHALYHKGYESGLPSELLFTTTNLNPENDYLTTLSKLGASLNYNRDFTMESLDDFLCENGWQPPRDMLQRYSQHNEWVKKRFFFPRKTLPDSQKDINCFIIRELAVKNGFEKKLITMIEEDGHKILKVIYLDQSKKDRAIKHIRGGNWGNGPWPISGGNPAILIVTKNNQIISVPTEIQREHPFLENYQVYLTKNKIRDFYNKNLEDKFHHCNIIHSSDNTLEAWDYISIIDPQTSAQIKMELNA